MWARALTLSLAVLLFSRLSPAEPAHRVVSMNPSFTAILLALGAGSSLVGVDEFSAREHPAIADLPTVGGLYNPGLEAVVALAPDLVVLVPSAEQRDFRARLATLDIPCLELNPTRFDEVLDAIGRLGARVGREEAAAARVRAIRRVRSGVEEATRGLRRKSPIPASPGNGSSTPRRRSSSTRRTRPTTRGSTGPGGRRCRR
jgi:ABC-type hemin transport system substrate-binding protein